MKKTSNLSKVKYAAIALALPLAVGTTPEVQAHQTGTVSEVRQNPVQIVEARMINPTTVELVYANGQQLTIDFYGENIFRLFQDNNGGIVRNPKAKPQADILVKNPRRAFNRTNPVKLKVEDANVVVKTNEAVINVDRKSGLMTVVNAKGEKVIEMLEPFAIAAKKTTLTLKERDGEYF